MRWRAAIVAVAAACTFAPVLHATAPGAVLDQSAAVNPDDLSNNFSLTYPGGIIHPVQTFTAGMTGLLTDVVLPLSNQYYVRGPYHPNLPALTGPFTVRIEDTTDGYGAPDPGATLASSTFNLPLEPTNSRGHVDVDVSFPSPPAIVKGHVYAISLPAPAPSCWVFTSDTQFDPAYCDVFYGASAGALMGLYWVGPRADVYSGGSAFEADKASGQETWDWGFQTYVAPDTEPPSQPLRVVGTLTGSTLQLDWNPSSDNAAVDHYDIYLGSKTVTDTTEPPVTIANLPTGAVSRFTVRAVDTSGNTGAPSAPVTVAPAPRPQGAPRVVPAWALRLLAWQQRGKQGARPKTPSPLPSWYAAWSRWRLNPLQVVGG
jgi:hypothetical protein